MPELVYHIRFDANLTTPITVHHNLRHRLPRLLLSVFGLIVIALPAVAQQGISLEEAIAGARPHAQKKLGSTPVLVRAYAGGGIDEDDGFNLSTGRSDHWSIYFDDEGHTRGVVVFVSTYDKGKPEFEADDSEVYEESGEMEIGKGHDTPDELARALKENAVLNDYLKSHPDAAVAGVEVEADPFRYDLEALSIDPGTAYVIDMTSEADPLKECICVFSLSTGESECLAIERPIMPLLAPDISFADAYDIAYKKAAGSLGKGIVFVDASSGTTGLREVDYPGIDLATGLADNWMMTFTDAGGMKGMDFVVIRKLTGELVAYDLEMSLEQRPWLKPLPLPKGTASTPDGIIAALRGNASFAEYVEAYPDATTLFINYSTPTLPAEEWGEEWQKFNETPTWVIEINRPYGDNPACYCMIGLENGVTECMIYDKEGAYEDPYEVDDSYLDSYDE